MLPIVLLLSSFFGLAFPTIVQPQQTQLEANSIAGTILNATSGQPLNNASVSISGTDDRTPLAEVITGPDGRFIFTHLRDGKYSLLASHRGFLAAAYDEHPTGSTAIVVGPGLVSTGLQFKLQPHAAIYGVITEDSGDPVPSARVALYRVTSDGSQSGGTPSRAQQGSTDDDGAFEISNLAPGKYYIAVTGQPWYATQSPSVFSVSRSTEPAGHPHSPLDVAYPTTFYPDATDQAYASPIELAGGERVPVNLTLHAVPSIHITVQFRNSQTIPPPNGGIEQTIFGFPDPVQASISLTTPDAKPGSDAVTTVELSGFAPGQYNLALPSAGGDASNVMQANLTTDQSIDLSNAVPLTQISGKVTRLDRDPAQEAHLTPGQAQNSADQEPRFNLQIRLIAQQGQRQSSAPIAKNGSFQIPQIAPGTYDVSVVDGNTSLAIAQLSATGATVEGHQIKIGSDPVSLSAKVVDSTATIHGFAKLGGKSVGGIFLELVPMGKSGPLPRSNDTQTNQSDSDGSFDFPNVLPGIYTLVAIEEGWTLDFANPDSIQPYLAHGLKITIPLHSKDIVLKDAVEVQPK